MKFTPSWAKLRRGFHWREEGVTRKEMVNWGEKGEGWGLMGFHLLGKWGGGEIGERGLVFSWGEGWSVVTG